MKSKRGWGVIILLGLVLLVAPGTCMSLMSSGTTRVTASGMTGGYSGGMTGISALLMNPYVSLALMLVQLLGIPVLIVGSVGLVVNMYRAGRNNS